MPLRDSWSDLEPSVPYTPRLDEMTAREIERMIQEEARYLKAWERIWARSSENRKGKGKNKRRRGKR